MGRVLLTLVLHSGRAAVLEECRLGKEQYGVRGTPTLMLENGTKVRSPIAFPVMRERRIMRVQQLLCCGESCMAATRDLLEQALHQPPHAQPS